MLERLPDLLVARLATDPDLADVPIVVDAPEDDPDAATVVVTFDGVGVQARSTAGTEVVERDGRKYRRQRLPTVEVAFDLEVVGGDARSRLAALGAVLRTALRTTELVDDEGDGPVQVQVTRDRVATSVGLRLTAPLDVGLDRELADAPSSAELGVSDQETGAESRRRVVAGSCDDPAAVGAEVIGPAGVATIEADGSFAIPARPGDTVTVMVDPPLTAVVPDAGPIVVD